MTKNLTQKYLEQQQCQKINSALTRISWIRVVIINPWVTLSQTRLSSTIKKNPTHYALKFN